MYDHPGHPLPARTDLRWSGVDPGGVHAGDAGKPSGLGHVRLRLLLHHDFYLDGGVRLRGASQQRQLGCSRLCVSRHRCLLLPQCFSVFGQSDPGDEKREQLPKLPAGHLCSGLLVRGDSPLLHPHHPVCHPMEIFLEVSSLQSLVNQNRTDFLSCGALT